MFFSNKKTTDFKDSFQQYLQTEEPMAKAIRQAIREQKLPLLAQCITNKKDKDG